MSKHIEVVAAVIKLGARIFATQRGYGPWKDWWEFPGGKIEQGESPQEALKREIREELDAEIEVDTLLRTVEWDYPDFHLTLHCYWCSLSGSSLTLKEHEAAKWLTSNELHSVKWLPADNRLLDEIGRELIETGNTRCLYHAPLDIFMNCSDKEVFGEIVSSYHGVDQTTTNEAWEGEIRILQSALRPWSNENAHIIFEYDIPRLGKRIDVVLLLRGIIFCLEFKVGKDEALQADLEQVMDYALDLKNFHLFSEDKTIVPILIPTAYNSTTSTFFPSVYDDSIYNPLISGETGLTTLINDVLERENAIKDKSDWGLRWLKSPYKPTPTIIEAARKLYENHSVDDITRHEADKVSTDATIAYILKVIEYSKSKNEKSICFVTGVPGAGKTLVGLDVAVKQTYKDGDKANEEDGAVYLSGNGPLVNVLTEALARDNYKKCKAKGESKNITDSRREVGKFIQIIHRYRDNMFAKIKNPIENGILEIDPEKAVKLEGSGYAEVEHVAIFDEAQRSWTKEHIASWLKKGGSYGNKTKIADFPMSEAEFLIWSLDQREDWAVIICLVGGGQEINTGEAGIGEWIKALNETFTNWKVYISPKLTEAEYAEGNVNSLLASNKNVIFNDSLHLAVNLRSFRAENLSAFVHHLLSFNPEAAPLYEQIQTNNYPIVLTRDISKAKNWLRNISRGNQRTGIVVSSAAARLKPLAIDIRVSPDAVHWFLEDKDDTRSSTYLEDVATEFDVQGLELDYTCLVWDADFRCEGKRWGYYRFNGSTKWNPVKNDEDRQKYMLNAYRVLLTRARMGMVICVPYGNDGRNSLGFPDDSTRLPEFYDGTYNYLKSLGIVELK